MQSLGLALRINDFCVYNLCRRKTNIVHPSHPSHLVGGFQRLGNTLRLGHLLSNSVQPFLCLLVNIGKVAVKTATEQQAGIAGLAIFFDVPQVPLAPQADGLFLGGCSVFFSRWMEAQTARAPPQAVLTLSASPGSRKRSLAASTPPPAIWTM